MYNKIKSFSGDYKFLSNFYPCFIEVDGLRFPSVEHAFQASKSLDPDVRWQFQLCPTCAEAKRRGRKIQLRPDWEQVKIDVMHNLLKVKFSNQCLRQLLLSTGDAELEEANNHGDNFWGTVGGEGRNELGKLLMKVRDEIR